MHFIEFFNYNVYKAIKCIRIAMILIHNILYHNGQTGFDFRGSDFKYETINITVES